MPQNRHIQKRDGEMKIQTDKIPISFGVHILLKYMKNKITMKIGNMFRITNMKTEDYKNLIFLL